MLIMAEQIVWLKHKSMHAYYILACMDTYLIQIGSYKREIKLSMGSGEYAAENDWAHNITQAHKLACVAVICVLAQAHN